MDLVEINRVAPRVGDRRRAPRVSDRDRLRSLAAELAIAEEKERRRIAYGLHDEVGQLLGIAKVKLGEALAGGSADEVARLVADGRQLVERSIDEIRTLTFELSSPVLQELGLEAAVSSLGERMAARHGFSFRLEGSAAPLELPGELAVLVYQVVRELLWNVVKHARAREVVVEIGVDGERLRIAVEDDGVGFDDSEAHDRPSASGGLGLFSARERLDFLLGGLWVASTIGGGTRVILTVPVDR